MKQIIADKYKRFVLYVEIVLVLVLLFIVYNFIPVNHGVKTFYLPSSNPNDIIKTLKEKGYEVTAIDKIMLGLIHTPDKGWYTLDPEKNGRFLFFEHMYRQKSGKLMDIIVYAGETKEELLERLSNDMKLDKTKLKQRYDTLARFKEADILAGRYTVAREADENSTIEYLFHTTNQQISQFEKKYCKGKTDPVEMQVIYKVASIIQKESNSPKEMPLISSVIYNRIEKNMRLQMDSTLNYGPYAHTVITPERIKSDESHYNTYKYKGLPPSPLSTVTLEALKAAIYPADTNYLFFMLTPSGEHRFSANYEEHLKNIRAFRQYQKDKKLGKILKKREKQANEISKGKQKKQIQEEFSSQFAVVPAAY